MQRFQAVPYTDSSAFEERMAGLERDSADDQLTRYRAATKLVDENPKASIQDIARKMVQQNGPDKKLLERVVDVWTANQRGITPQERRILALPTAQRAMYVTDELTRLTDPQEKAAALREFALKRILTEGVAEEMVRQKEK